MTPSVVLLVLPWSPQHAGGVTGVVRALIANWGDGAGSTPLLTINDWQARTPRTEADGLHFKFDLLVTTSAWTLAKSALAAPARLLRTWRLLRGQRVVAVNFHYTGLAPLGIAVLKACGLWRGSLVISFHGTDVRPPVNRVEAACRRFLFRHADHLVACSRSLADRMITTMPAPREKTSVVFNGADTAVFRPDAARPPGFAPVPAARYVVSVGAFIERKAHADLIEAFARLAADHPELDLCLAGADGPTRPALQARAEALGIATRVHWRVGITPAEVAHLLATATLCVQPALAESLPLAVLEAGASGVPVAVSDIPGHDELIVDGRTGRRFAVADPLSCERAMRVMLADRDGSRATAATFRDQVVTTLTWPIAVGRYRRLYLGSSE